jgi:LmbE family N-acetylglucosaminyl deacetylase
VRHYRLKLPSPILAVVLLAVAFGCGSTVDHAKPSPSTPASDARLPRPLDVLIVAPHPDDEALGCTGVMLQAIDRGQRVGIALLTNGDAFPKAAAIVSGKTVDALTPADQLKLAAHRQGQTLEAMGNIGVARADMLFLAYPDGGLQTLLASEPDALYRQALSGKEETYPARMPDYHSTRHGKPAPYTKAAIVGDLAEILRERRPTDVYITNDADQHPDHRAALDLVREAARAAGFGAALRTYVVHGKAPARPADLRVPLTPAQVQRKRVVIDLYARGLSPLHDQLAEKHAQPEEVFWLVPVE